MPQPFDAGGLEAHVGIDTARDGVVNDPLLLLLQQLDQLLLGTDVAPDSRVRVVEEADNGSLLRERGKGYTRIGQILVLNTLNGRTLLRPFTNQRFFVAKH